jgi:tetratricopeptide (TPR) repeat protein
VRAWGLFEATAHWRRQKVILALDSALALAACFWSIRVQVGYWRNSETLFIHTVQVTGPNYIAYHHLDTDLVNRGKIDQAIVCTGSPWPSRLLMPRPITILGVVYPRLGKFADAVPYFKKAIQLAPYDLSYYRNLIQA